MEHQTRLTTSEPDQPSESPTQWIVDGSITPAYTPMLGSTAASATAHRWPSLPTIMSATAACLVSLLITLAIASWTGGFSIVWLGTCVNVAILLLVPRRHWWCY